MKNVLPGKMENEQEIARSLRERGFYKSGVPRSERDVPAPKARRLSRKEFERLVFLNSLTPVQFEQLAENIRKGGKAR